MAHVFDFPVVEISPRRGTAVYAADRQEGINQNVSAFYLILCFGDGANLRK
jgi:hypothetical protein